MAYIYADTPVHLDSLGSSGVQLTTRLTSRTSSSACVNTNVHTSTLSMPAHIALTLAKNTTGKTCITKPLFPLMMNTAKQAQCILYGEGRHKGGQLLQALQIGHKRQTPSTGLWRNMLSLYLNKSCTWLPAKLLDYFLLSNKSNTM